MRAGDRGAARHPGPRHKRSRCKGDGRDRLPPRARFIDRAGSPELEGPVSARPDRAIRPVAAAGRASLASTRGCASTSGLARWCSSPSRDLFGSLAVLPSGSSGRGSRSRTAATAGSPAASRRSRSTARQTPAPIGSRTCGWSTRSERWRRPRSWCRSQRPNGRRNCGDASTHRRCRPQTAARDARRYEHQAKLAAIPAPARTQDHAREPTPAPQIANAARTIAARNNLPGHFSFSRTTRRVIGGPGRRAGFCSGPTTKRSSRTDLLRPLGRQRGTLGGEPASGSFCARGPCAGKLTHRGPTSGLSSRWLGLDLPPDLPPRQRQTVANTGTGRDAKPQ